MKTTAPLLCLRLITVLLLGAFAGCSRQHSIASRLIQADRYFSAGDYDRAEIEYLNVLQLDPQEASAAGRLGVIYFDEGRFTRAVPYLLKGRELRPQDAQIRVKLGWAYLSAGKRKEAREEAEFVLNLAPENPEAPMLLAKAAADPAAIEAARVRLDALSKEFKEKSAVQVALGTLDCSQGHFKEAEERFKRAETLDPKSSMVKEALGTLYWSQKDLVRAEQALVSAVDLAPGRAPVRLELVQFKLQKGDRDGARLVLEQEVKKNPDWVRPLILLAELAVLNNDIPQGEALVGKVLAREASLPEALVLSARIKLAKGDSANAIVELEKIVTLYPAAAQGHYYLAQADLMIGEVGRATTRLNQAVLLSPNFVDALVLLAGLDLTKGDFNSAIVVLKPLIRSHPDLAQPRLLLAEAYRRSNDPEKALGVYRELEQSFPRNPQTSWLTGLILIQQDKKAQAKIAFDHALEVEPDYLPATEQEVYLDLADAHYEVARERVEKQIALHPKRAGPHLILAQVFLAQKQNDAAESALRDAIALEPDAAGAYLILARLYISSNQQQKALANLKEVVARKPKEAAAWMLMGVIYDQEKNDQAAAESYEKLLAIDPKFSAALNNLAYLYSERLGKVDQAFELAKRARELLPGEPNTADTLGWILYRRHQYPWALSLLTESARALPSNAQIAYHLGMIHYRMGEENAARLALQEAVKLSPEFLGRDEAKAALVILAVEPAKADQSGRAAVDLRLVQEPDDPVALTRLALLQERDGQIDKALASFEAALKQSPNNVSVITKMADLYRENKDLSKAMELAKLARKLDPNDPGIAHALGRLAYLTQNYRWALSLLQESIAKRPEDAELCYDWACAAFGLGQLDEAAATLNRALASPFLFRDRDNAQQLLAMIVLLKNPADELGAAETVEKKLQTSPGDLAASMIKAGIDEQTSNLGAAKTIYQDILNRSPEFVLAKKRLAILELENSGDLLKAYDLAMKTREDLPKDPDMAKVLGIISFRQGQFQKAAGLLKESIAARSDDGELTYYYGASLYRLKDNVASQQVLQRALRLNLKKDLATEAKKMLDDLI